MSDRVHDEDRPLTVGQIARKLGKPVYQVTYAIQKARVDPAERVGVLRRFSPEGVGRIKSALDEIAARRRGGADEQ